MIRKYWYFNIQLNDVDFERCDVFICFSLFSILKFSFISIVLSRRKIIVDKFATKNYKERNRISNLI